MSSNKLHVEVVESLEELERHAEAWNNLALASPQKLPMPSHAWVSSYFEYQIEPGETWLCLFAYENDKLIGVLPVVKTPRSILGLKEPCLRVPHNEDTFGVDVLAKAGREKKLISLFCRILDRIYPSRCVMEFKRLPESSPTLSMEGERMKHTLVLSDLSGFGSYIPVVGSFEDYHARLQARFRRNLRRLGRKFQRLGNTSVSFHTNGLNAHEHLKKFIEIEASGWKGRRGSAIACKPSAVSFFTALTRKLAEIGWLEWHFLHAQGRAIAGQLAIKVNRSLIIFKIGYDETYAQFSPGSILFEKMIERAFETGEIDEINCLSEGAWMRNWAMEKKAYYDIYFFPMRPLPLLFSFMPAKMREFGRHAQGIRSFSQFFRNLKERSRR
ncbi:MAG: GNAT family N-acetyltransferase [Candidatus Glassbacteria bacterium]